MVLQQYVKEDKGFTFTEKGKEKPWTVMRDHLTKFITAALQCPTSKSCSKTPDDETFFRLSHNQGEISENPCYALLLKNWVTSVLPQCY